jgi:hypothetical protein
MVLATPRILLVRLAAGLLVVSAGLATAHAQTAAPPAGVLADPVFQAAQKRY